MNVGRIIDYFFPRKTYENIITEFTEVWRENNGTGTSPKIKLNLNQSGELKLTLNYAVR